MKSKTWILALGGFVLLTLVIAVTFINREKDSVVESEADFSLSAAELIDAFAEDEMKADALYGGKVLELQGAVKQMTGDESAPILVIGDTTRHIGISCYLQSGTAEQYAGLQRGDVVKVKGICNGMLTDIMLDRTILLTR